jgi:hypothetical protein
VGLILLVAVVAGLAGFAAGAGTMLVVRRGAVTQALRPALPTRENDVLRASLRDVRKGGLVKLPGFGDDFDDVDLEVERYEKTVLGREEWHVLEGTYRNRPVGVGWQDERGTPRTYALKRMRVQLAEVGLTQAALDALASTRTHTHGGVAYDVEEQGKALRHENGTGFGKEHKAWFLASKDKSKVLRIERWGDEPAQVTLGEAMDPTTVEIYKVKG